MHESQGTSWSIISFVESLTFRQHIYICVCVYVCMHCNISFFIFFPPFVLNFWYIHARALPFGKQHLFPNLYTYMYMHSQVYLSCRACIYVFTCNHARKKIESRGKLSITPWSITSLRLSLSLYPSFPRDFLFLFLYFVHICVVPIFLMYLYYLYIFFLCDGDVLCEWRSPFIFLSYKCKLVTITYWTMFNNTFNTRVKPDAFLLCCVTCNGHTLFSCTISCNYDDDDDPLFSLSHLFVSFSPSLVSARLFLFLPLSLSVFLCIPTMMTLYSSAAPLCFLLFTFPCFFLPFSYPVLIAQPLDIVIDWAKCIY